MSPYNAWKLVSLSPLPPWSLWALGLAAVAGVVLAGMGLSRERSVFRKLLLNGLRLGAGLAAFLFLLEPGIRHMQVARVKNRIAVLVDRSGSMSFPADVGGASRSAQVGSYLERVHGALTALKDRFTVERIGFDPELSPITPEQLIHERPKGSVTNLLGALRALKSTDAAGSQKLSGVLLFSDGADNGELGPGVGGKARSELSALGIPVSTFLVGQEGILDLAVENVKVDDFAFVRNSITVEVDVKGRGFPGREVPVVLKREGQVVATKTVRLKSADDTETTSFTFTPDQTGRFVYTVSVPVFPEEVVTENNSRSFVLKVIRDRIRVLLVVGRPSWDERFLRGFLKQNANVDLVSFYILRTSSDDTKVVNQERELALIPFPMEEIFDSKLSTFDVVIFQNFGYTDPALNIGLYEGKLEQYVFNGGAFVEIGGDHAFGEGRANFPVLGKALPVEPSGATARVEPFAPRLTLEGLRHPVTQIANGGALSEAAWASLPPLSGANMVRVKSGASVLLDHPFAVIDGKNAPILALWDYGRGRSMALTVDDSWVWAFTSHREGSPNHLYDRFWGNALRWLVRDPDLTTLQVTAEPASVEPGRPVGAVVTARKSNYEAAGGASVKVELFSVLLQRVIASQTVTAGPDGTARVTFPSPDPGPYKLLAEARLGDSVLGVGEDALAVRALGPELSDPSVRPELLEQIARLTGGKSFRLPLSGLPAVPLLNPPAVEIGRSKDQPLWDRWYYLVALAALLGGEWFARRRFGYI